jgi:single-stranded-DNA-specific exonuclease
MKSEAPSPPEIVRRLLAGRGIEGDAEVSAYFNPALSDFSPSDLPGIDDAAEAILACDGLVVVFGDYDCDGICASAILVECLRKIGKQVEPFLPERLSEGYGMSDQSVSRMLSLYPSVALVVTVDNGINANCQTRMLREKGVKVVITDHHLPGSELPQADALVNPCVSAPDGMRPLCGAAVAFVLAASLVEKARSRKLYSGGSIAGPMLVMA